MIGDYRTVMLPTIDVIRFDTFELTRQYHHDLYASRGVFDWYFKYSLVPLLPSNVLHITKPFETPVMAGGLFVITATFFWELGAYDEGLDTYGKIELDIESQIFQCTLKLYIILFGVFFFVFFI